MYVALTNDEPWQTKRDMQDNTDECCHVGPSIWSSKLGRRNARQADEYIDGTRRIALQCVSAYCITFTDALCMLARTPPVDFVAEKRAMVFNKKEDMNANAIRQISNETRNAAAF